MTAMLHEQMAAGRWWELSLCEQMGNIGSEVSRMFKWRTRNPAIAEGAMERALELFDLTLADPRHLRSVARLREIARAREVLLDFFVGPNQYNSTASSLQRYFDVFAVAAARAK
jgi:hypothetical protein